MGRVVWMGRGRDEFCSEMTGLKMHSLKKTKNKKKTTKKQENKGEGKTEFSNCNGLFTVAGRLKVQ